MNRGEEEASGGETMEADRCHAAIATIESLVLNLRTMRRGSFPPDAKRRMTEMLRLGAEAVEILRRQVGGR